MTDDTAVLDPPIEGQESLEDTGDPPPESETTGQFRFSRLAGVRPTTSTFSVSGALASDDEEFDVDHPLVVTITTPGGEVVATAEVEVAAVGVKRLRDSDGFPIGAERQHKLKVD